MDCSVGHVTLAPNTPAVHACASVCLATQSCRLYCLNFRPTGNECFIFSALVTQNWKGDPDSSVTFDVCYSTWYHSGDITHLVSSTAASSILQHSTTGDKAVDGFSCRQVPHQCFHSYVRSGAKSWWRADLGIPRSVSRLLVFTRNDGNQAAHFSNIIITLGNSTLTGQNPVFASLDSGVTGQMMDFIVTTPMIGRYLEFITSPQLFLVICEVKIIS
ncbi:hypothetical protein Pmani_014868 [Petrolisthes manimaculis]|uniref:Apple domain-containing protein n=1 Tax=Petrolisthes manimaculis TaxID=1843537 RepID=A0AAE1UAI8_9EUCA|nr:hypothetical protein Pmani_014868 [Petrolisthes manimaculis]